MPKNSYEQGVCDGLMSAARILWNAAEDHQTQGSLSRKVLDTHAHQLAAELLKSWGNGLEIKANGFGSPAAPTEGE